MSSSLDYFNRGITRAFERRKEQQSKQNVQHVQKVDSDASNVVTTTNTKQSTDEQYRTTIIQLMVNHIKQKKETN